MWQISNVIRNSSHKIQLLLSDNAYMSEQTQAEDGAEASEAIGKYNIIINTAYTYSRTQREESFGELKSDIIRIFHSIPFQCDVM